MANVHRHHVTFPLTVETDAYADGDLMSDAVEISVANGASARLIPTGHGPAKITDIAVVDTDDLGPDFDIYFSVLSTTWGTVNAGLATTDAIAAGVTGMLSVATADYEDFIAAKVAFKTGLSIPIREVQGGGVYVATVSRGTPDFVNTDALTLEIGVELN